MTEDDPNSLKHGWTPNTQKKDDNMTGKEDKMRRPDETRGWKPSSGQTPSGDNPNPKPPAGGFNTPPATSTPPPASPSSDNDS